MRRFLPLVVLAGALFAVPTAHATVGVNAVQGPTPQVGGIGPDSQVHAFPTDSDGTLHVRSVLVSSCANAKHSVVSLSTGAASAVPASALSGRATVQIVNSRENTGSPLIKCRIDGTPPVMGTSNAGDVFAPGEGTIYAIPSTQGIQCITDTNGTAVTVLEC